MAPTIFDDNQYIMYIPFSKHIALENKLIDAGIDYWFDSEVIQLLR